MVKTLQITKDLRKVKKAFGRLVYKLRVSSRTFVYIFVCFTCDFSIWFRICRSFRKLNYHCHSMVCSEFYDWISIKWCCSVHFCWNYSISRLYPSNKTSRILRCWCCCTCCKVVKCNERTLIVWLCACFCCVGVPFGLVSGSLPFLLKSRTTYSGIGVLSLATWPYSLKCLWSPVVDAVFSFRFGRRKTWIVPCTFVSGLAFGALSLSIDDWVGLSVAANATNTDTDTATINVRALTMWFFLITAMLATQDIAVDAWSVLLISKEVLHFRVLCHSHTRAYTHRGWLGRLLRKQLAWYTSHCSLFVFHSCYLLLFVRLQGIGNFLAFPVLLALLSPQLCAKYLCSASFVEQNPGGTVISLGSFLAFWSLLSVLELICPMFSIVSLVM